MTEIRAQGSASTAAIRAEQLTKRFGELTAVDQLDLSVPRGEILGLLGPNGAGKSTAIRMLTGQLEPTRGRVFLGSEILRFRELDTKRRIGVCPQEPLLWERLSCVENLDFLGRMFGLGSGATVRRRSSELLDALGIAEQHKVRAGKLSGGMKKRLNLAMALVHDPEIAVLDEPITGLDPQARLLVSDYIRHLCESGGKTVLLTTHLMEVAAKLCDRVAIIDHGRLLVSDTVESIEQTLGRGDVVEITLTRPSRTEAARDMIGALPEVENVVELEGRIRFQALGAVRMLPEVFRRLQEMQAEIEDLTLRPNTLEDIFISLTGRGLRDGP